MCSCRLANQVGIPLVFLLTGVLGCNSPVASDLPVGTLFTSVPSEVSGLEFVNKLDYDRNFNIYTYRNFYNGGGVALGDVNQDGLLDAYFTANMKSNRLYLNQGDFKFEDVTEATGIGGNRAWSTGVSMADINGDGLLDIYVCNSGDIEGDNKQNELYLNQGNDENGIPQFVESAEELGLADQGFSTHIAFFDYDKDGDLDAYLLNNSFRAIGSFNLMENERTIRDEIGGDKLFRNDNGKFIDVSEEAGIYGSIIGFGLGVTVGDINRDQWPDIYVSNDFFERDYLYLNNHDGTFEEVLTEQFNSISAASMGADMADLNQDGYPEVFVTDMLPEQDARIKQVTMFEDWTKYQDNLKYDYYHQFSRNMLHLNNGNGSFSEIGRLVGVESTDWSWGALFFDMDNDGLRDIYVANGIYQDLTDLDYINFIADGGTQREIISNKGVDYQRLIDSIPVRPVANYAFHNLGYQGSAVAVPSFENNAESWGLATPSFSNGSAYGDFDNDGDLDLIVNNVNMEPFLYRNNTDSLFPERKSIRFELTGKDENPFALGTQIEVWAGEQYWFTEQMPMRGFQSTMDFRPQIGLGESQSVDSIKVTWPDGNISKLGNTATGEIINMAWTDAHPHTESEIKNLPPSGTQGIFTSASVIGDLAQWTHEENAYNDFNRDRLIYHMMSTDGPAKAIADFNGDGKEDLFLGGAAGQAASLFLQSPRGVFMKNPQVVFLDAQASEDIDAEAFDADGDGDIDIYVASGSNEFTDASLELRDRLYLNNGRGQFTLSEQVLPAGRLENTACVHPADFDGDGDIDLAVGIRMKPFLYGVPVNVYLLENDGNGKFTNVSQQIAPELAELGMITDVKWTDLDGDNDPDLVVLGDWMAPQVFINESGKLARQTSDNGLNNQSGWWTCIEPADLDGDGDMDLILGNHGLNSRFRASKEKPIQMFVNDFDGNGRPEQIMARYIGDTLKTYVRKSDLTMQMPGLRRKYLRYSSYVNESMEDIFGHRALESSVQLSANQLASCVALNNGDGTFTLKPLPIEAQMSTSHGFVVDDFDKDGKLDILVGGNFYASKPEVGRYDASYGVVLKGNGSGEFAALPYESTSLMITGQVRELGSLNIGGRKSVLVVKNNEPVEIIYY